MHHVIVDSTGILSTLIIIIIIMIIIIITIITTTIIITTIIIIISYPRPIDKPYALDPKSPHELDDVHTSMIYVH